MKYTQEKGFLIQRKIEVDLQKTGLTYTSTETSFFKKEDEVTEVFFSYGEISNQKTYIRSANSLKKNIYIRTAIFLLVIYFVTLGSAGLLSQGDSNLTRSLIYTPIVLALAIYSAFIKTKYLILHTHQGGRLVFFADKVAEDINKDILAHRNTYLREKYIDDTATKNILTQETLDWLFSLKIISAEELATISAHNKKDISSVGFNK